MTAAATVGINFFVVAMKQVEMHEVDDVQKRR